MDRVAKTREQVDGARVLEDQRGFDYAEERPFRELARRIPGHRGWFFDIASGNLVVYLKDLSDADAAKGLLRSMLAHQLSETRRRHPRADVVVREATYTWLQLRQWRDWLRPVMLMNPGIGSLDLDEIRNRVVIGLDYGIDPAPGRQEARSLGIPEKAVEVEISGPFVPLPKVKDGHQG